MLVRIYMAIWAMTFIFLTVAMFDMEMYITGLFCAFSAAILIYEI